MNLVIRPDGTVHAVYGEAVELSAFGPVRISRASQVEPTGDGLRTADLAPVGGPLLGPFPKRTSALEAERRWLEEHWLPNV